MRNKLIKKMGMVLLVATLSLSGCGSSDKMKDGFYTAEMSEYSHGWKEYICILVKADKIVYVEFNAKDPSGYIKAWDNAYMTEMKSVTGTYPNEYTRYYAAQIIDGQGSEEIDALSGASHSHSNFLRLSAAAIEQAKKGDDATAIVTSETE